MKDVITEIIKTIHTLQPEVSRFCGNNVNGKWVLITRGPLASFNISQPFIAIFSIISIFSIELEFSSKNSFLTSSCTKRLNLQRKNYSCEIKELRLKYKKIYSKNGDRSVNGIFKAPSKSKLFTINQIISWVHVVPFKK